MNPVRPTKSTRRRFGIQSAIAASTAVAGVVTSSVLQAQSHAKNNTHSSAFETETGGQIYHLPRDHATHGGDWYKGAEYQETHYFTGFFTDKRTGKPYSVFFCWTSYGWDAKLGRPIWVSLFTASPSEGFPEAGDFKAFTKW